MREINLIVIHCSATRCDRDYPFRDLDNDHRSRGWNGCGYHYYVTKDGRVHVGRREDQVGAHAEKFNAHSIGVCYEGGLTPEGKSDDTRTEAQKRSMATLIRDLQRRYPKARILGHRDLPGVRKDCPCFDVRQDLIAGTSSPGRNNLPDIRGTPSPGRNVLPEISGTLFWGRNIFPEIQGRVFRGRNILPEIQDRPSPGRNILPEIPGTLFRGRNILPDIQGTLSRHRNKQNKFHL